MHIFKNYEDTKGILIITHKEISFLSNFLNTIKDKYYLLIHYGFNVPINNYDFVTYNMMPISRCINNKCLPFTSRNFLNKDFNNKEGIEIVNKNLIDMLKKYNIKFDIKINEKNFDFIFVNRAAEFKKTYDLLNYIINYIKLNTYVKACFIILEQNVNNSYYKSILNFWNNNKLNNILFLDTYILNINNNYYKGFTSKELSYFYKTSKIYIHGCENEGESRTIHEALCCGCKILAKENMLGGGLDYLNSNNSILYNHNNALNKMNDILNNYHNYIYDYKLFEELNEEYSIERFLNILYNNLNYKNNCTFDEFKNKVNTNNLAFSLPAHNLSVTWYIKGKVTSDIFTDKQYKIFLNSINL